MKKEKILGGLVFIQILTSLYYLPSSYKYFLTLIDQSLLESFGGLFMLLMRYGFLILAGIGLYQFWQNQNIFNRCLKVYFIYDLFSYVVELPRLALIFSRDSFLDISLPFSFIFFQILSFGTCILTIIIFSKEKIQVVENPVVKRRTRFLHLFIDWIIILVVSAQLISSASLFFGAIVTTTSTLILYIIIPYLIPTLYYVISEGIFQQTIGKVVTKKYVRKINGQRASAGSIFGRTLARFIPFEAFSYFSTPPNGWHDSLSKTNVYDRSEGYEADIMEHLIAED